MLCILDGELVKFHADKLCKSQTSSMLGGDTGSGSVPVTTLPWWRVYRCHHLFKSSTELLRATAMVTLWPWPDRSRSWRWLLLTSGRIWAPPQHLWSRISLLQIAPRLWRREMRSEPKYLQVVIGTSRSIDYNPYQTQPKSVILI